MGGIEKRFDFGDQRGAVGRGGDQSGARLGGGIAPAVRKPSIAAFRDENPGRLGWFLRCVGSLPCGEFFNARE